jgi:hypothetical protein
VIYNCAFVGCDKNHFTAFKFGKILWPNRGMIVICLTFSLYVIFILECTMKWHFLLVKKTNNMFCIATYKKLNICERIFTVSP